MPRSSCVAEDARDRHRHPLQQLRDVDERQRRVVDRAGVDREHERTPSSGTRTRKYLRSDASPVSGTTRAAVPGDRPVRRDTWPRRDPGGLGRPSGGVGVHRRAESVSGGGGLHRPDGRRRASAGGEPGAVAAGTDRAVGERAGPPARARRRPRRTRRARRRRRSRTSSHRIVRRARGRCVDDGARARARAGFAVVRGEPSRARGQVVGRRADVDERRVADEAANRSAARRADQRRVDAAHALGRRRRPAARRRPTRRPPARR